MVIFKIIMIGLIKTNKGGDNEVSRLIFINNFVFKKTKI